MKLNLACGSDYKEGWQNLDVTAWPGYRPPDVLWDARKDAIPFPDGTVDEVYAGYLLLHLMPFYRPFVLAEILRVLKPEGVAVFSEVDMEIVMGKWLHDPTDTRLSELIWGELGSEHGRKMAEFDEHRWGYTRPTLLRELLGAGFEQPEYLTIHHPDVFWELTLGVVKGKS